MTKLPPVGGFEFDGSHNLVRLKIICSDGKRRTAEMTPEFLETVTRVNNNTVKIDDYGYNLFWNQNVKNGTR